MTEQPIDNPVEWIEEAITKKYFKYYDYQHFSNIEEVGHGSFGKVCRVNWKMSEQYLALKSFFTFSDATAKEIIRELRLQRDVDFHNNIIRFYGITLENQDSPKKNYSLVMEYADGGTLKQYLAKNFNKLTWDDKIQIAYQLACAVSCLHNENIVHSDLHPSNILVHQNNIKLADFGLSRRIEEASYQQSKLFGIIPYVDPKNFSRQRGNNNKKQYSLNKGSDIYSIGVLLWMISSGQPPFQDDLPYDFGLAFEISNGLRETPVPDTPIGYSKLYIECWDYDSDKRPTIFEVINQLKAIKSTNNVHDSENLVVHMQKVNIDEVKNSSPSNIIFNSADIKDCFESEEKSLNESSNKSDNKNLSEEKLNKNMTTDSESDITKHDRAIMYGMGVNKDDVLSNKLLSKSDNKNLSEKKLNKNMTDNISNYIDSSSTSWTDVNNKQSSVESYREVSTTDSESDITKYDRAIMYRDGMGVNKDDVKAFKLFKELAEEEHLDGMNMLGECYYDGRGVSIDKQQAFGLFQKAADLGNNVAKYNLGRMYDDGDYVEKDDEKARELFKSSSEGGYEKATEAFSNKILQKAISIGVKTAEINLDSFEPKFKTIESLFAEINELKQ